MFILFVSEDHLTSLWIFYFNLQFHPTWSISKLFNFSDMLAIFLIRPCHKQYRYCGRDGLISKLYIVDNYKSVKHVFTLESPNGIQIKYKYILIVTWIRNILCIRLAHATHNWFKQKKLITETSQFSKSSIEWKWFTILSTTTTDETVIIILFILYDIISSTELVD